MISKSMSRKTPSFGQLVSYMSSEKADDSFDLHQNCLARGEADIAAAFAANSQHLKTRKNGNYLYHEILSISLEQGVEREHAKQCLREIALEYISKRCPRNMVYGCLHDDHSDHLHYHLMVSANAQHETARLRLSKSEFDRVKRDLEAHVLQHYPQLKQRKIVTADRDEKNISHKASKQKQRTGKLERQDGVRATILEAMRHTSNLEDFKAYLEVKRYRFYTRGKHYGVEVVHDTGKVAKYRFATIGVHEDFECYVATLGQAKDAQEAPERPRGAHDDAHGTERSENNQAEDLKPENADEKPKYQEEEKPSRAEHSTKAHVAFEEPLESDVAQDKHDLRSSKVPKTEFQRDMERIYAKKREKRAERKGKTLKRKPRSR